MKPKTQTIGFYVLFALAGLVVFFLLWPFWELLAFAVILAILFHPFYERIEKHANMPNLTALFVVVLIALIIIGPLFLIGQQLFFELAGLYQNLHLGNWTVSQETFISRLPQSLQNLVVALNFDARNWLTQLTGQAFSSVSGLVSSIGWFFGSLVVVAFSTFFLLRDWDKIRKMLADVLPLSEANENILFNRLSSAVDGVIKGQFLVSLSQATASAVGFAIFGIPNVLLWACLVFLSSFVPTIGTGLVLIPAVIYLFLTGHVGASIGMAIWAWACVGLIDNVLAAKLVSSRVRLHPILTIFAILGGVACFGVLGILLGPILMAIFVQLVQIYQTQIKART
ncbi:MAG: AI-2E family transporter [Patescibacteria group bacterium]|nr:AI-2E family transporter [Patescibacteria group bacterium]